MTQFEKAIATQQKLYNTVGLYYLSNFYQPNGDKHRLAQTTNHHISWCEENNAKSLATPWNDVLSYMWSKDNSYCMPEFKRLIQMLNHHRNESLVKSIPELKWIMNE